MPPKAIEAHSLFLRDEAVHVSGGVNIFDHYQIFPFIHGMKNASEPLTPSENQHFPKATSH